MHVEQRAEPRARLVQQLDAGGAVVVALEMLAVVEVGRIAAADADPVAAMLAEDRRADRPLLPERHARGRLEVGRRVRAERDRRIPVGRTQHRLDRVELDHARRRVATEQAALRAAQHFDVLEVEDREALQDRVLLDDVVVDQRDRLRRVGVEVGVAVAADVDAREGAAVRRLDVQARHLAGQHADVLARRRDGLERLRVQDRRRDRHVLVVLGLPLRRDVDLFELRAARRRRVGRHGLCTGRQHRPGGDDGDQDREPRMPWTRTKRGKRSSGSAHEKSDRGEKGSRVRRHDNPQTITGGR